MDRTGWIAVIACMAAMVWYVMWQGKQAQDYAEKQKAAAAAEPAAEPGDDSRGDTGTASGTEPATAPGVDAADAQGDTPPVDADAKDAAPASDAGTAGHSGCTGNTHDTGNTRDSGIAGRRRRGVLPAERFSARANDKFRGPAWRRSNCSSTIAGWRAAMASSRSTRQPRLRSELSAPVPARWIARRGTCPSTTTPRWCFSRISPPKDCASRSAITCPGLPMRTETRPTPTW